MDKRIDRFESDFLFVRPSFIEGVGRMFDISGSYNTYNYSRDDREADARAFYRDWRAIGRDFRAALNQLRSQRPK